MKNSKLLPRVVHKEYFDVYGVADIDKEADRFGFVRPLGNNVYAFLALQMEIAGAVALRNAQQEHLDEMGVNADTAWDQGYANVAALIQEGAFKQAVTKTEAGNDWAVWIGENFTSSCVLIPAFYKWCRAHLQGDRFMVCIASTQLVFVLQLCSREALVNFAPVINKMLEGSASVVSTDWFVLSSTGLTPMPPMSPSRATAQKTAGAAAQANQPAEPQEKKSSGLAQAFKTFRRILNRL